MRFSLALIAATVLSLSMENTADAQIFRGGGRGRVSIGIGIGSGGYGYGYPGYYSGYGGYPGYYGRSGISLSIGRGGYYGNYGSYYNPGYSYNNYYSPGYYSYNPSYYSGYSSSYYNPSYYSNYSRPYSSWHRGWQHGSWSWANTPSIWTNYSSSSVFGSSGARVYTNPYVSGTPITVGTVNYSNPLPDPPKQIPEVSEEAMGPFNEARDAFRRGDYKTALERVDKAIEKAPADSTLSEFRALCLFAMKDYKQAAQVLHPVLTEGPGWDWATVKALYDDPDTYTKQLRALEDHYLANKDDAATSFLLAYHYLVLDYPKNARTHLQNVARLEPKDQLASELLKAME
jgi:tetratricopeptide (TPR) repeat protein